MDRETRQITRWVTFGVLGIIGLVLLGQTISFQKVEGNEAVVRQHFVSGLSEDVWRDGTHIYCGWLWDIYKYDVGTQKITFDHEENNPGAEYGPIMVDVGENGGQKVWVALSVNYRPGWETDEQGNPRFSAHKLVALHKDGIGQDYEEVILKRAVVEVVNQLTRTTQALAIYSGEGFVTLARDLDAAIKTHPQLVERGIYVDNTILYKVYLDPAYENEIAQKQLAIQQTLRKKEETKAAEEEARRAFAQAQAEVERRRQAAEANKIEQIKQAEAKAEQQVLAAEAEKKKRIAEAEGERDANLAKASGVLAVGTAEAEVDALKREALYGGNSGAWRARVEIAALQAEKLRGMLNGVKVVPEKTVQLLWDDSIKAPNLTLDQGSN